MLQIWENNAEKKSILSIYILLNRRFLEFHGSGKQVWSLVTVQIVLLPTIQHLDHFKRMSLCPIYHGRAKLLGLPCLSQKRKTVTSQKKVLHDQSTAKTLVAANCEYLPKPKDSLDPIYNIHQLSIHAVDSILAIALGCN